MKTYIDSLIEVIYNLHQVVAKHVGSEEIEEIQNDKVVWSGVVDIFEVVNHPTATHCFAWEETCGKNQEDLRYVAILNTQTLRTPRQAVQKMLAQDALHQQQAQPRMTSRRRKLI